MGLAGRCGPNGGTYCSAGSRTAAAILWERFPSAVTSRSNSAIHHDGMTNAFGGFAIRLTDGEWTVNVTMPSGRVYPVRNVTVSDGRVMDNQEGREVHNLIISY